MRGLQRVLIGFFVVSAVLSGWVSDCFGAAVEEPRKPEPVTNVEKFMARRGRLVVKDFYTVGSVAGLGGSVKVQAVATYAPGASAQEKVFGIRFERPGVERYESSQISFLDYDESKAALDALVFMQQLADKMAREEHEYTEIVYETRGAMRFGFFQSGQKQNAFVEVGGPIAHKSVFIGIQDLPLLARVIRDGIDKLAELGAAGEAATPMPRP